MKALSIIQPFASLIAIGSKTIETRSWPTKHRGWIAIHASKAFSDACQRFCSSEPCRSELKKGFDSIRDLPRGAIIAAAQISDCQPTGLFIPYKLSVNELAFGDFSSGRFAWFLTNIIPLKNPIPCKGALSLWTPPEEIDRQLYIALNGARMLKEIGERNSDVDKS
jgi:activating signal cointegrator 1